MSNLTDATHTNPGSQQDRSKADEQSITNSLVTTGLTNKDSASGTSVAASMDNDGKPLHIIAIITQDTGYGGPMMYGVSTLTFAPGSPVACVGNRWGAWPCLKLDKWTRRGPDYLKDKLSLALYDDLSVKSTDEDLKNYTLVIDEGNKRAKEDMSEEIEGWGLNAFDSITTHPKLFKEVASSEEESDTYLHGLPLSSIGNAFKPIPGDMFGYLVRAQDGALVCFFQAQHRRF